MLNISDNKTKLQSLNRYATVKNLENRPHYKILNKIIAGVSIMGIIILFLPWTQNVSGTGAVTTLKPNQRPQSIQSVISGRIEKWYVQEGDFVNKGDTILFISEIKEEYMDPNLVKNTKNQVNAKKQSCTPAAPPQALLFLLASLCCILRLRGTGFPGAPRGDENGSSRRSGAGTVLFQVRTLALARPRCARAFAGVF